MLTDPSFTLHYQLFQALLLCRCGDQSLEGATYRYPGSCDCPKGQYLENLQLFVSV